MQALLKRAGSKLRPPIGSLWPASKVVVEGLASTIDDRILREAFSPYGEVTQARVMLDRAGRSIGSGVVTYKDYDSCDRAVDAMHQWEVHGQTVRVKWAPPPGGYDGVDLDVSRPLSLVRPIISTSVRDRWRSIFYDRLLLAPGMVLLKNYLTLMGQADIVNICQKRAIGPGGFYTPRSPSGDKLALSMMCYGRQWDPVAKYEKRYRSDDGSDPPPIPDEFMSLVDIAIQDAHKAHVIEFPRMRPDTCIANFYTLNGRLALHQDCDESSDSLKRGSPVVSISIGDSADFWYGHTRDEINKVRLDSGDVLIFGGKARLYFHGVRDIFEWSAPRHLSIDTGLKPGRLNLTLKEY